MRSATAERPRIEWDRSVPVEIGPFVDQDDLLRFAIVLETVPLVGGVSLVDAEPRSALFVIRAGSPDLAAAALASVPGYRITATPMGNSVRARVDNEMSRALQLVVPPPRALQPIVVAPVAPVAPVVVPGPSWFRVLALMAILLLALGSGLLLSGRLDAPGLGFLRGSTPADDTPPASATSAPPAVVVTPAPTAASTPSSETPAPATAVPASPSPAPATPEATTPAGSPPASSGAGGPQQTATPGSTAGGIPVPGGGPAPGSGGGVPTGGAAPGSTVTGLQSGFAGSLGTLVALNGCEWRIPFAAELTVPESGSGEATLVMHISYVVSKTPSGAFCNPSVVNTTTLGTGAVVGNRVTARFTGDRDLLVTFEGTKQGEQAVGTVRVRREVGSVSPVGNTTETRTATIPLVTLAPAD